MRDWSFGLGCFGYVRRWCTFVLRCHCSEGLEDWDMLALGAIEVGCQDLQCILRTRHCEVVFRVHDGYKSWYSLPLCRISEMSSGADRLVCAVVTVVAASKIR